MLDVLLSLIAIPFLLLFICIFGPIIYLEDRGPIFYKAMRLGKGGKPFTMYKFRSMKVNAPDIRNEDGSTYNSDDDPRLTRIGRFLRKTSLDEVPQLINVLLGDMSLIGPRPDLVEQMKYYEKGDERKLEVRPGITGYNQAYYRNAVPWKQRIQHDIYYIDNISFWLDVKILFKTVISVLKHKDVYVEQKKAG
ncbi:Sugar transferase involved in LPS biosynthesis (colanic, teichoic acid) [Thermoclostridium caenicola]|uniref:Sugar transferase involved in LPS biosynthesis (Colanic, teichoic acid) n=2 Tax=Thermoclostridium caenicola TaxID=659425 RepID=A0A1M6J2Y7_9FIRM|nr:sugar transferase [Thermoclostridium caenicola]SHJ41029.1 Sugar transferase involved in LPS biosynthesis (colanic, teichoic acid) [Thermoclostridium caenicola]